MRDKTHMESLERWALLVKENPTKWQRMHSEFINAQFDLHEKFLKRLIEQKNGKEKIIQLYNIKNIKGYSFLK